MPVQTRNSLLCDDQQPSLEDQQPSLEENTEVAPDHDISVASSSVSNPRDECCGCCDRHRLELETLKEEIKKIKSYFKFPAKNQPSASKADSLERNNRALIAAVEALSKQVLQQGLTPKQTSPEQTRASTTDESKRLSKLPDVQIINESSTRPGTRKKPKRKRNKSRPVIETRPNSVGPSMPQSQSTEPSISNTAAKTSTPATAKKKKVVVIAGDSIVKNIIGAKMSAGDQSHHYVVKPFPGATLSDMEDFVKPLARRSPDKLILRIGTNDLRHFSPKAIADSTINLVTQIKEDSPGTLVGVSALLIRNDNDELAVKVCQVNDILRDYCSCNNIHFLSNSNIIQTHLNNSGLHLNKQGSLVLQKNLLDFSNSIST